MFNSYCHSANFLAFLKDSSPDHSPLLARLRRAVKDRNFQYERHWEDGTQDGTPDRTDGRLAPADEIVTLRESSYGRDAEEVTVIDQLEQRHLTYRPGGKCPWVFFKDSTFNQMKAGCLLKLYRFKRDGQDKTAALVESYVELTDKEAVEGDYYRKWESLAGRLYNVDAAPSIIIPAQGIMHHAIHRRYRSKELKKMVRHLMPLSKVGFLSVKIRLLLYGSPLVFRTQYTKA